jgi:two-component system, OmpR family, sensor histidine kinase BaeS
VNRQRPRRRLLRRLFVGQLLVILAGAATLGVVAFLVAPPIFHDHVRRAVGPVSDVVASHLDAALSETLLLALAIGIGAAAATAGAVSWLLATRIARPIEELSATADALAAGHLDARATPPVADDELADLTGAFNAMADSLEHTEQTRRRLLADLAHELRTPLATVEAYHEGLADGVIDPDPATVDVLADATSRLRRLVEDVSLVSLAEEGRLPFDLHPVDLRDLVTNAIDALQPTADTAGIALSHHLPETPVTVDADPDRLAQVLANLLANAIEHTRGGDTITVAVTSGDHRAVIEVTDTGAGISPQHLPHIFQRFYRADPARRRTQGSGIGLTISRAIVQGHGGDLTAASPGEGRGTTFSIDLPTDGASTRATS